MRACPVGVLMFAALASTIGAQPAPRPVLAELFTSEGCSSCPPADALLRRVASQPPVGGVQVVALEEHVDYWDGSGWRDPFSAAQFTRRQSIYDARVFHTGDIYTPQLVVDGTEQCIGSDPGAVAHAIARAARAPGADVTIRADRAPDGRTAAITVSVAMPPDLGRRGDADLVAVVSEDGLTTDVRGGENRGRTMAHGSVARSWTAIGKVGAAERSADATASLPLSPAWNASRLRVVAFVQERDSRRVLGVGAAAIR